MSNNWSPSSWQNAKDKKQMPTYLDKEELNKVKEHLKENKPLTLSSDIIKLKDDLKLVENGEAFIIQGGDCAEDLHNAKRENTENTIQLLEKMADIVNKKVVKIGRMAGQYAKPRSSDTEISNGIELPSYRGDIVNTLEFTKDGRTPRPLLMLKAYQQSLNTINIINNRVYTSHEALLLDYEESLVREENGKTYLLSTHLPWIGERTRSIDSAHTEFLRGVMNPIGIKVSAKTDIEDLIEIIKIINPSNESGKIILTIRMGADNIMENLPRIITGIQVNNLNVIWINDPMHGNGKKLADGTKTRFLSDIEKELLDFNTVCKSSGIVNGGIQLEMTGLDVSECMGLSINEKNINEKYKTLCDPRLNSEQCLHIAELLKGVI